MKLMSHLLCHIFVLVFVFILLGSTLRLGRTLCAVCHEMRKNLCLLKQEIKASAAISFDFVIKFSLLFARGTSCRLRGSLILPKYKQINMLVCVKHLLSNRVPFKRRHAASVPFQADW